MTDSLQRGTPADAGSVASPEERPTSKLRVSRMRAAYLIVPAALLLVAVFYIPLIEIARRSFTEPTLGLGNYSSLLTDGVSVTVVVRTLVTSTIISTVTLVLMYPYAYAMTRVSPRTRAVLIFIVLLPLWTSVMARTFAWYVLEQRNGVIDRLISLFGIANDGLLGTPVGVGVAMVQVMMPFMALPLYASLAGIDHRLVDVAVSCGARRLKALATIYVPLSVPGIASGFSLVFIMSLGFYVTPVILGSPGQALAAQLIGIRVSTLLDFGGGGALGLVLLVLTLITLVSFGRLSRTSSVLRREVGSQ